MQTKRNASGATTLWTHSEKWNLSGVTLLWRNNVETNGIYLLLGRVGCKTSRDITLLQCAISCEFGPFVLLSNIAPRPPVHEDMCRRTHHHLHLLPKFFATRDFHLYPPCLRRIRGMVSEVACRVLITTSRSTLCPMVATSAWRSVCPRVRLGDHSSNS